MGKSKTTRTENGPLEIEELINSHVFAPCDPPIESSKKRITVGPIPDGIFFVLCEPADAFWRHNRNGLQDFRFPVDLNRIE
jgi:hypothetical protein